MTVSKYSAMISRLEGQEHQGYLVWKVKELHWLPVSARIKFISNAYKCLSSLAPPYIVEPLESYTPGRSLRSGNQNLMNVPKSNLKQFGSKAFCSVAATPWNELPLELKRVPTIQKFKIQIENASLWGILFLVVSSYTITLLSKCSALSMLKCGEKRYIHILLLYLKATFV